MTNGTGHGDNSRSRPHFGAGGTRADSNYPFLPRGLKNRATSGWETTPSFLSPLASDPLLPRSQLTQTMFDVLTVLVCILLGVLGLLTVAGPILAVVIMVFFD